MCAIFYSAIYLFFSDKTCHVSVQDYILFKSVYCSGKLKLALTVILKNVFYIGRNIIKLYASLRFYVSHRCYVSFVLKVP